MRKEKIKNDYIYEGIILISVALSLLLIVFGAFKGSGKYVTDFFLGSFGYAIYGYTFGLLAIGVLRLFKYNSKVSKLKTFGLILALISIILTIHVISSKNLVALGYGEYLKQCYITGNTAGGIIAGIFMYPIMRLNYYFAVVAMILLVFISLFMAFFVEINKGVNFRTRTIDIKKTKKGGELVDLSKIESTTSDVMVKNELYVGSSSEHFKSSRGSLPSDWYVPLDKLGELRVNEVAQTERLGEVEKANTPKSSLEQAKKILYESNLKKTKESILDDVELSDEDKKRKAMELLYSKEESEKPKTPKKAELPKEDFSAYTNNFRLNLIRENLSKKNGLEASTTKNTNDNKVNLSPDIIEDVKIDKTEVIDLSATTFDDLAGFEDIIKQRNEKKDELQQKNMLKGHLSERFVDLEEKNRKERSDKGGMHFGGGVKFTNIPSALNNNNINNIERDDKIFDQSSNSDKNIPRPIFENKEKGGEVEKTMEIKSFTMTPKNISYKAPPIGLLKEYISSPQQSEDFSAKIEKLENLLSSFNIDAKVVRVVTGPTFTRLELQMPQGISVNKIGGYANDICMCLEAESIRCQIPIRGKNAFGVEIPNKTRGTVGLKAIFNSSNFNSNRQEISFAVGQDCDGQSYVVDLAKMPHLLIAGSTGAGKSVCINTLICSILFKYSPVQVKMILVDPKQVELNMYNGLPHMLLKEAVCDKEKVIAMLDWAIEEMELRYTIFNQLRVKNLPEFNECEKVKQEAKLPYIVLIIDEVADIVADLKRDFEDRIKKLAAKARAAGIVMVLATQRPDVSVITGTIKANLPSRIAFAVTNFVDSKTIIDCQGAEKLLRNGDMLLSLSTSPDPVRIQGAFISNKEIDAICEYIKDNNECYFDPEIEELINTDKKAKNNLGTVGNSSLSDNAKVDPKFIKALHYFIESGSVSISKLQRRFSLGFPTAGALVDKMETMGYVSKPKENKTRDLLIDMNTFMSLYGDCELE